MKRPATGSKRACGSNAPLGSPQNASRFWLKSKAPLRFFTLMNPLTVVKMNEALTAPLLSGGMRPELAMVSPSTVDSGAEMRARCGPR